MVDGDVDDNDDNNNATATLSMKADKTKFRSFLFNTDKRAGVG